MKKLISILLTLCMVFSLAACSKVTSGSAGSGTGDAKKVDLSDVTIGIVGYNDSGTAYKAMVAFYNQIAKATGIKFKFVKGSSFDEAANVTAVQNLISSGVNGIIMTMDSSMTNIMKEAEAANVYVAGYLNSMDQSLNKIKDNKYFLGTVSDGYLKGDKIGQKAAELVVKNNKKNVGVITYPHNYFPNHAQADKAFRAAINEYNKTAADKVTLYDSEQLSFKPVDPTYFKKYPKLDAIFGMALTFVYPTMLSANIQNVNLYATGYDDSESYMKSFNAGNIGMMTCSNSEAMIYPVALIANAVKGTQFTDKPASAEAVETNTVFLTNADEIKTFNANTIFSSGDVSRSLLTDEKILSLIKATNKDASYQDLVKTIQSWSMEDIKAKTK
jgi:ABC-type sugar transport system substrate-binding protein